MYRVYNGFMVLFLFFYYILNIFTAIYNYIFNRITLEKVITIVL